MMFKKKRTLMLATLAFASSMAFAQSKVSGTIKDAAGEPLIGVSIVDVATGRGTISDMNGNYTLNVEPSAQLQFSYVGFNTVRLKASQSRVVTLEENQKSLNEVVVVGYGTMRRKDVTSSITTVQAKDLNQETLCL